MGRCAPDKGLMPEKVRGPLTVFYFKRAVVCMFRKVEVPQLVLPPKHLKCQDLGFCWVCGNPITFTFCHPSKKQT